jgi:peptidoglycan/LPS O-acetylase OafA/YrhL
VLQKVARSERNTVSLSAADYAAADKIGYFYGIDLLRGLAAVTILIWHYQHFYITADTKWIDGAPAIDRAAQPFYHLLWPLYEHGFWAVGGFWVISGFVFSHVYAGKVTTAGEFAGARFARLYPLSLITLITIALIQLASGNLVGHYQIVGSIDITSFVENLLFISGWGLPGGGNFNGPIWSVSVELVIYAGFFFVARRIYSFGLLVPGFIIVATWMLVNDESPVWNFPLCAFFFFTGSALYYWLLKFRRRPVILAAPGVISLGLFVYYVASGKSAMMRFYDVQCYLFPPIVLLVGWLDFKPSFHRLIKPVKWLGNTTYSTYLWHFPIQVLILTIFSYFGWGSRIFNSPATLIIWVVGMVFLAHLSFIKLEKPLQNFVRGKLDDAKFQQPRPLLTPSGASTE